MWVICLLSGLVVEHVDVEDFNSTIYATFPRLALASQSKAEALVCITVIEDLCEGKI